MIARISFEHYEDRQSLVTAAATPEGLAVLAEVFGESLPAPEHIGQSYMWPENTLIDMESDGPKLTAIKVGFRVKSFKGTMPLTAVLPNGVPMTVQVQIPHIGLLAMDEVQVLEDCCTDVLQKNLDFGWRILCVCPPNAARRPDYIMGRTRA